MTNMGSITGGALWIAIASLLMLAALEPVEIDAGATPLVLAEAPLSVGLA